jgi:Mg-chelatase subunit ChlD
MRRSTRIHALGLSILLTCLPALAAPAAPTARLTVEIQEPAPGSVVSPAQAPGGRVEVVGGASIYGGVRALDLFLVLDSSESLRRTDPDDHRTRGVIHLVRSLHPKANIHVGVVDFDRKARRIAELTADREAVITALGTLDQKGETDLAAGIRSALEGFAERGRVDASKVILLFTDGKSDEKKALEAMAEARRAGVAIHTLLLGDVEKGETLLRQIARGTDASFVAVTDPARLSDAFLNLRTTGVERVRVRVGSDPPIEARLVGGSFTADVRLHPGPNHIEAMATSLSGETAHSAVDVVLSGPLRVSIDTPADGSELPADDAEQGVLVQGHASTWDVGLEELGAEPVDAGVREVWLRVNDSAPYPTRLVRGRFEGRVPLADGENRIVAIATSVDGRSAQDAVQLASRAPGCAELEIQAMRGNRPAISLSDRAIEVVFDASNSMWGRMDGEPKISVAKRTLSQAIDALPEDLSLALRVYGHQYPHAQRRCHDSELLVPATRGSRARIQEAIRGFKPRGQTPLAYSLREVGRDLAHFRGERAVVLVTDGIESCDGDPIAAARELQRLGDVPVYVIGFGLDSANDEDLSSLRGIARASGGRFVTAGSADELRDALATSVGTPFALLQGDRTLATGSLGSPEPVRVPGGDYRLRIESKPAYEVPLSLAQEQGLTLMLKREGAKVFHARRTHEIPYERCDPVTASDAPSDGLQWEELPDADPLPAARGH